MENQKDRIDTRLRASTPSWQIIYEPDRGERYDVVLTNPPFGTKRRKPRPDRDDRHRDHDSLEDADELPEPQDLAAEAITELEAVVNDLREIVALVEKEEGVEK
jgi:hypothetical protein